MDEQSLVSRAQTAERDCSHRIRWHFIPGARDFPDGDVYDLLRRYARPKRGLDGLAFGQITGPASGSYFVGWNGTGPMKLRTQFIPT